MKFWFKSLIIYFLGNVFQTSLNLEESLPQFRLMTFQNFVLTILSRLNFNLYNN